jgi:hypothetical protein
MSKRLENFIRDHREDFDDLEPCVDLWSRIEQQLPAEPVQQPKKKEAKSFSLGFVMRVAAMIVVVMGIGFAIYLHSASRRGVDLAAINPVYAKEHVQYASLVHAKRTELLQLASSDPQLYHEFSRDIAKMDSSYKKLNQALATSPNQERVLRAMIQNLQIQTEVLNQQLQVIEQFKEYKNQQQNNNETKNI